MEEIDIIICLIKIDKYLKNIKKIYRDDILIYFLNIKMSDPIIP